MGRPERDAAIDAGSDADMDHLTCPICLEAPFVEPVSMPCGHTLDLRCFERVAATRQPKCPVCRAAISKATAAFPNLALRTCIERHYEAPLRRRWQDSIWEELHAGKPSSKALNFILEQLKGGDKASVATQMLLAISGSCVGTLAEVPAEVISALLPLSEAAWAALRSACEGGAVGAGVLQCESLIQALQEMGGAAPDARLLLRLVELALEQCQILWAVADNGGVGGEVSASLHECDEDGAENIEPCWCAVLAASVLQALFSAGKRLALELPKDYASSAVGVLGEIISLSGGVTLCGVFDTVGAFLLASKPTRADLEGPSWKRLRTGLLDGLSSRVVGSGEQPELPDIRAAARACAHVLYEGASVGFLDAGWTELVLQRAHERLEDPHTVVDDSTARHLLGLLGDLYSFLPSTVTSEREAVIVVLVGPAGKRFHKSWSLARSAAEQADESASPRRKELHLGALEAFEGLLGFLRQLPDEDAARGFVSQAVEMLSILDRRLLGAHVSEELASCFRVLEHVVQLCTRDASGVPWCGVLARLREQPYYLGAIARADSLNEGLKRRGEALIYDAGPLRALLLKLGLPIKQRHGCPEIARFGGGLLQQASLQRHPPPSLHPPSASSTVATDTLSGEPTQPLPRSSNRTRRGARRVMVH